MVGGLGHVVRQLKEMVTLPLLYPEVFSALHTRPPGYASAFKFLEKSASVVSQHVPDSRRLV